MFLTALSEISNPAGPAPGPHNGFRGGPFAARDRWVRPVILEGPHPFDRNELLEFWQYAIELEAPSAGHRWLHGDLTPFNLLAEAGQITAVIDWGALAVGDPACDLMIAWNFDEPARTALRDQLAVDDSDLGARAGRGVLALDQRSHDRPRQRDDTTHRSRTHRLPKQQIADRGRVEAQVGSNGLKPTTVRWTPSTEPAPLTKRRSGRPRRWTRPALWAGDIWHPHTGTLRMGDGYGSSTPTLASQRPISGETFLPVALGGEP